MSSVCAVVRYQMPLLSALSSLKAGLTLEKPLHQFVLERFRLVVAKLAGRPQLFDGLEFAADLGRVVKFALGLVIYLLRDPRHTAHRRQRQGEQAGDKTHR